MQYYAGLARLAERCGVGPSAVANWRKRHADFPEPDGRLLTTAGHEGTPMWANDGQAVVDWHVARQRVKATRLEARARALHEQARHIREAEE